MERVQFNVGGQTRTALVAVPPAHAPLPPTGWPLICVVHGRGGTGLYMKAVTGFSDYADAGAAVVAFPEATRRDPSASVHILRNPTVWNAGGPYIPEPQRSVDDVAYFATLLSELELRYPIDPDRIHGVGFSNGASMMLRLATQMPQCWASIAAVAGGRSVDHKAGVLPPALLYMTGDADPLNPIDGGPFRTPWEEWEDRPPVHELLASYAAALGCAVAPTPLDGFPTGVRAERYAPGPTSRGRDIVSIVIAGAGHNWPGGRSVLSQHVAGPAVNTIQATAVIWDFFMERPRN